MRVTGLTVALIDEYELYAVLGLVVSMLKSPIIETSSW